MSSFHQRSPGKRRAKSPVRVRFEEREDVLTEIEVQQVLSV